MNADQAALWHRIQAHALDDAHSPHPFSLRLAKENDWPPGYTQRAIEEYRRFAFLAVAAGHPVSPSDPVDQVWHLHLLYTRDYWEEFCGRVLGTPLHHGPARGGAAEVDKFTDWYARTRASYRRFFGEPPVEFWPEKLVHPRARRIDVARHWIIPKPRLLARLAAWRTARLPARPVAAAATFAATVTSARGATGADFQPLNLRGPAFLEFYFWLALSCVVAALFLRWYLRRPADLPADRTLDPYAAARLAQDRPRVVETAIFSACARGLLEVRDHRLFRTAAPVPAGLPLVERAVIAAVSADGTAPAATYAAAGAALDDIERDLAQRGLTLRGWDLQVALAVPVLVALSAPAFGLVKAVVGHTRNHPVGFLLVACFLSIICAIAFLWPIRRTRRGDRLLATLRREHAALARHSAAAPADAALPAGAAAGALPLAVGLFGLGALAGTPHSALASELELERQRKATEYAGSACSTVSGDSSGDSDGGASGGGDGASGCGGCGGGGGD